jgi:hypothetical protein
MVVGRSLFHALRTSERYLGLESTISMELQFTQEQEAKLAQIARLSGKADAAELLKDAALRLLDEDARFRAVARRKVSAERGEFIEEGEMDARFEEMLPG